MSGGASVSTYHEPLIKSRRCRMICIAYLLFLRLSLRAHVFLRVYNQPLLANQAVLEHWIARCQWDTVVPTFNDKIDLRQHAAHLREACGMMTEIV